MGRVLKVLMMTLLSLGIGMSPALAQNAHFIGDPTCPAKGITSTGARLTCSGSIAGLGRGKAAIFLTADSVRATFLCVDKGGDTAPGTPATTQDLQGPTRTINPARGGSTSRCSSRRRRTPPKGAGCPNGNWSVVLTAATFTDVVLYVERPPGTEVLHWDFGDIDPS